MRFLLFDFILELIGILNWSVTYYTYNFFPTGFQQPMMSTITIETFLNHLNRHLRQVFDWLFFYELIFLFHQALATEIRNRLTILPLKKFDSNKWIISVRKQQASHCLKLIFFLQNLHFCYFHRHVNSFSGTMFQDGNVGTTTIYYTWQSDSLSSILRSPMTSSTKTLQRIRYRSAS